MCFTFGGSEQILEGYADADMEVDLDGRKSTSRLLFTLAGRVVS